MTVVDSPLDEDAAAAGVPEAGHKPRARIVGRVGDLLFPLTGLAGIMVAWQLATWLFDVPRYIIPPPLEIGHRMVVDQSVLAEHALVTLAAIAGGFIGAVVVGVALGALLAFSRTAERILYPLLVFSQSIPKVAIAPLFVVWFGFGMMPKVVVALLIAFFPIVIATVVGLKGTSIELIYLLRSMGAGRFKIFKLIQLPNALPSVFGGLKVGITMAVVGAVVGEFVGADRGLGYLIQVARGSFDTVLLFAAIVELSFLAIVLFLLIQVIERRLLRWSETED
ncbi:MAG: ABC transporter permease [Acidimicrobiales bacterium]